MLEITPQVDSFERSYNEGRLSRLIEGSKVVKEEIYFPIRRGKVDLVKGVEVLISFTGSIGLMCLVLAFGIS